MCDSFTRNFTGLALIFCGGGAGSALRYLLTQILPVSGYHFSWASLAVNLLGAFALGILAGLTSRRVSSANKLLYCGLGTGFLGGFTTYSTLVAETLGTHGLAYLLYPGANLFLGLLFAFVGLAIGTRARWASPCREVENPRLGRETA